MDQPINNDDDQQPVQPAAPTAGITEPTTPAMSGAKPTAPETTPLEEPAQSTVEQPESTFAGSTAEPKKMVTCPHCGQQHEVSAE